MSAFQKATKKQAKLRLALEGPAGFGKTYTALTVARELVGPSGKIAFVDTEASSAAHYSDLFDFDTVALAPPFHPDRFVALIRDAEEDGYDLVVVDSLSHAWNGAGGLLELVDEIARTKYRGDSHRAWKDAGEIQQGLVDSILRARTHIIVCMRTKGDTVRDQVEKNGQTKTVIRKVGLKVVQRDELDYEFDIVGRFEQPAILTITKSRCADLPPTSTATDATDRRSIIEKPGAPFAATLAGWLGSGEAEVPRANGAERKKLDKVIAALADAAPAPGQFSTWLEVAEAFAKREFAHGVGALTKPEMLKTTEQLAGHLEQLKTAAANGAEEPKQAELEGAAA